MSAWLLMGLLSAAVTSRTQALTVSVRVPWAYRPLIAFDALGFYLMKTVWPFPLAADYGRTPAALGNNPRLMIPTLAALVIVSAILWLAIRRNEAYKLGILWPIVLAPVLGLLPFGYQRISTVADHYNYLPLALAAALVAIALGNARWLSQRSALAALIALVAVESGASLARIEDWRGEDRFFTDMLAKNPASVTAKVDLSAMMCGRGNWQGGLAMIEGALLDAPSDAPVLANRAFCLYQAGRIEEVLALQSRIRESEVSENLERNSAAATILLNSLAGAFVAIGKPLHAFAYLCQALTISPNDADIAANISSVKQKLSEAGREVQCPRDHLPWGRLVAIVDGLK
jgi:tetratricopeptide (TPR) repeat protein